MIDINKEAEEYANSFRFISETDSWFNNKCNSFIAGHNSKATQYKVLQFSIEQFKKLTERQGGYSFKDVSERLKWLEERLKEFEK
jgi:hypothetical protein